VPKYSVGQYRGAKLLRDKAFLGLKPNYYMINTIINITTEYTGVHNHFPDDAVMLSNYTLRERIPFVLNSSDSSQFLFSPFLIISVTEKREAATDTTMFPRETGVYDIAISRNVASKVS
jgi:hypothetical protein